MPARSPRRLAALVASDVGAALTANRASISRRIRARAVRARLPDLLVVMRDGRSSPITTTCRRDCSTRTAELESVQSNGARRVRPARGPRGRTGRTRRPARPDATGSVPTAAGGRGEFAADHGRRHAGRPRRRARRSPAVLRIVRRARADDGAGGGRACCSSGRRSSRWSSSGRRAGG